MSADGEEGDDDDDRSEGAELSARLLSCSPEQSRHSHCDQSGSVWLSLAPEVCHAPGLSSFLSPANSD